MYGMLRGGFPYLHSLTKEEKVTLDWDGVG